MAERFPIIKSTLAYLAHLGRGPRYFRPTYKVLYRPEEVEAWIEASAVVPKPEDAQPQTGRTPAVEARKP